MRFRFGADSLFTALNSVLLSPQYKRRHQDIEATGPVLGQLVDWDVCMSQLPLSVTESQVRTQPQTGYTTVVLNLQS